MDEEKEANEDCPECEKREKLKRLAEEHGWELKDGD